MKNQLIYTDNAATTAVSAEVLEGILPYLREAYGNPSSIYALGRKAKTAIEEARQKVAGLIGANPEEIYFTSGGSEADNWAIKGAALRLGARGKKHIVTSQIEHHAVLHSCKALERQGYEVTYLPVDRYGLVNPVAVKEAIRPDTALVTIMFANNEIGTLEPIEEIGAICRDAAVWFHTDAVQAAGHVPIDVEAMHIDMLSLSGHKMHAPKGVGALYMRRGVSLPNLIDGGAQEKNKRAGTENVASIVGLGVAAAAAQRDLTTNRAKITAMRDHLMAGIAKIERVRLNGHPTLRLPGNVNFSFEGIEGESLLLMLDLQGICASSGSACTSGSLDPSHVLLATGLPHEIAHGSLRLTLSDGNTMAEMDRILEVLPSVVDRLRAMSPTWEKILKENK